MKSSTEHDMPAYTTASKSGKIQSVDRALNILDILSDSEDGLTLAQISQRIDLPKSNTI